MNANSSMPRPAVVVPVWKTDLNFFEKISLKRHLSVLKGFDRFLLVPRRLSDCINAVLLESAIDPSEVFLHVVDDRWLASHPSYNQLMLSLCFYKFYAAYTHILVAQLDAYTFQDRLLDWCADDYDYVGAPIYYFGSYWEPELHCVGNGGFSLRKINSFIRALEANPIVFTLSDLRERLKPFNAKGKIVRLCQYAPCWLMRCNRLRQDRNMLARWAGVNEDLCYGKYLPLIVPDFRVPSYKEAVAFCIDSHVDQELSLLAPNLPFGAHGWWTWKQNLAAWRSFIEELDT